MPQGGDPPCVCVPVSHLCDMPSKSTQEVIWLLSVSQPRSTVQENPDFLDSFPILSDKATDSSTSVRGLHLPRPCAPAWDGKDFKVLRYLGQMWGEMEASDHSHMHTHMSSFDVPSLGSSCMPHVYTPIHKGSCS